MQKNIMTGLLITIIVIGFTGCTINHQIVPPLRQVDIQKLPEITMRHPVAIVAVRNPAAPMAEVCVGEVHRYISKIDDLTDSAVRNLEDMLKRKNITLDAKAAKILRIAVIDAYCNMNAVVGGVIAGRKYHVKIQVKAGDSITEDFWGYNVGGHIFGTDTHVSDAINEAFLKMFKSEAIVGYLKN
jgi:hypothetical protein